MLEPESDSDQMEIDQAKDEEREEEEVEDAVTPEQSDDETDKETGSAPRQRARSSETVGDGSEVAHGGTTEGAETTGVPPPRVLPFSKRTVATRSKGATAKSSGATAHAEDDETDDEEL